MSEDKWEQDNKEMTVGNNILTSKENDAEAKEVTQGPTESPPEVKGIEWARFWYSEVVPLERMVRDSAWFLGLVDLVASVTEFMGHMQSSW